MTTEKVKKYLRQKKRGLFPGGFSFLLFFFPLNSIPFFNMFQKIVNFWMSSFVTERLLASPLFNKMAQKTHHHVSTITDKGKVFFFESDRKSIDDSSLSFFIVL